ncbi:MAG: Ig-like domain-containing protein [Candidatus Methanofastidiosia archaeon]
MKGKKTIVVGLAILLSLSISTVTSKNDKLSVVYTFESTLGGCGEFLIKDTQVLAIPGEPLTPYKAARILLPEGTEAKNIKVDTGTPVVQEGFDIPWGQPPCTFSDIPVTVGRNEDIYNSDNLYPKEVFQVIGVEYCKGFAILNVHLFPVQYKPKSGTVIFYPEMTVEVQVGKSTKNDLYRGLASDKEDVQGMVDNPDVLATYEDKPAPLATEEYIIITSDTMQSTFQTLANWKAGCVNGATVYTVSWISSNYTGTDTQMKMRNFIIDKYYHNGTKYVLLGGDTSAVPYRGFYVSTGGYTDSDMLADMYFAHLDGSHNADGDSYYGEINDGVDFGAEVAVGRAPCQTVTEAQNFVNKVIAYEQADKPKRVLLHQSRVQSGNTPDSRCLAYNCDNYIPGDYTIDYLFEEDGTVSKSAWISHWAQNPVAVAHIGHGNTTVYYINYEVGGTVAWYNTDIPSMTNTFWPWTTSVACITGQIEANDCLAEAYVMDSNNGAIAAIYNDNYGWFNTGNACMYSGEFCQYEFRACWSDGKQELGDMLNKARSYLASSAQSDTTYRWCFYERNLVGDPESPCLTQRDCGGGNYTVTITNPSNGATVCGTVNVTTSTSGCIDSVEFYIDGALKATDTSSPFSYSWNTTTYSDGDYTILVKGYCSGVLQDDDSVTVNVDNTINYTVTITAPTSGQTVSGTVTCAATSNCSSVKWYIDGTYKAEDTSSPFQYSWDTTAYADGSHTILAEGYVSGTLQDTDSVTVCVDNDGGDPSGVTITSPPNESEVYGTAAITVSTTGCIDTVEFYINSELKHTDTASPFEYDWNTTTYLEDTTVTIEVKGYYAGQYRDSDIITVTVNNYYVEIVNPPEQGETVSCTVNIDVETRCIDTVEFYLDDILVLVDTTAPFQCVWDTCLSLDAAHTVEVRGYSSGVLRDSDTVTYQVYHYYVRITNPLDGETVRDTVPITIDANCVDTVKLYIDDELKLTQTIDPPHEGGTVQYEWDTLMYSNEHPHTITVKGYESEQFKGSQTITVPVDNRHIKITKPEEGQTVSGTITIETFTDSAVTVVVFWIDSTWLCTDTNYPFECEWDTCPYSGTHHIRAYAYGTQPLQDSSGTLDVPIGYYEVTVSVSNFYIEIDSPSPGAWVYGPVLITTNVGDCVDTVEFRIDGEYKDTDFLSPFEYMWDTFDYAEDESHTITVIAYYHGKIRQQRQISVIVDNYYVYILAPHEGDVLSGTVTISVDARGMDELQFSRNGYYFGSYYIGEDDEPPFDYSWDTTIFPNGPCTITVEGYKSFELKDEDSVNCTISNQSTILLLGLLVGITGFAKKSH